MISALYVVLGVLMVMKFALDVVRYRRHYRVAFGDGGFHDLRVAIRIHGNAVETIPLALLLLVMMEMNGADIWMVHLTGLIFRRAGHSCAGAAPQRACRTQVWHDADAVCAVRHGGV